MGADADNGPASLHEIINDSWEATGVNFKWEKNQFSYWKYHKATALDPLNSDYAFHWD